MGANQPSSARVRRDASAHAMQGWHSQRMVANGIIGDQVLKVKNLPFTGIHCIPFLIHIKMLSFLQDKDLIPLSSRGKNLKGFGMLHNFSPTHAFYAVSHIFLSTCLGVLKRKKASSPEYTPKLSRGKVNKSQLRRFG
jgi:hypothetical protein